MSKVLGPLLSLSARQTFGKTLTYSVWKGVNTVRLKSNPSNPQTDTQMAGRAFFAAGGKISKVSDPFETLAVELKAITPAQQSWISYFIGQMMGTGYANIEASKTAYNTGGNATVKGYFDDAAGQVGIQAVDLDGTSNTQVSAGLALWAAYQAAFGLNSAFAPVTAASASEGQVFAFTEALTGVLPT